MSVKVNASQANENLSCPYCKERIADSEHALSCGHCQTRLHEECAREARKCTTIGCERPFQFPKPKKKKKKDKKKAPEPVQGAPIVLPETVTNPETQLRSRERKLTFVGTVLLLIFTLFLIPILGTHIESLSATKVLSWKLKLLFVYLVVPGTFVTMALAFAHELRWVARARIGALFLSILGRNLIPFLFVLLILQKGQSTLLLQFLDAVFVAMAMGASKLFEVKD